MDTHTIARLLYKVFIERKRNGRRRPQFGCIPCDGLDNITVTRYPFAFCVNDSPSNSEGRHWIGLYIESRNKPVEFFCSFGKPVRLYSPHFKNFVCL